MVCLPCGGDRRGRAAAALAGLAVVGSAACGMTRLQTARTVPAGETRSTVAVSMRRGDRFADLPLDVMVRHGAGERVDWGVRLFFGFGLLGDVKWNLLRSDRATALALSAGLGAAADPGGSSRGAEVVHVPLAITLSRALVPWFSPYASLGYGSYWMLNYRDPARSYPPRTWTGDGLLMTEVGIELARSSGRALLLEYGYARPVVRDRGDGHFFVPEHLFSIGFGSARSGPDLFAR